MKKFLTIKNYRRETKLYKQRLLILSSILLLLILFLIGRLTYLQLIQRHLYVTLAQQNQLRLIPIAPNRGLIYDRNNALLAENLPVFSLEIIPDHITHLKNVVKKLQQLIDISPTDLQQFYKSLKQYPPYIPIPLKVKLTPEEVAKFYINRYQFPGVSVEATMLRYYPLSNTTADIIGHVGRLSIRELKHVNPTEYSA